MIGIDKETAGISVTWLCWKHIKGNSAFLKLFVSLGTEAQWNEDQLNGLEKFVCAIS